MPIDEAQIQKFLGERAEIYLNRIIFSIGIIVTTPENDPRREKLRAKFSVAHPPCEEGGVMEYSLLCLDDIDSIEKATYINIHYTDAPLIGKYKTGTPEYNAALESLKQIGF